MRAVTIARGKYEWWRRGRASREGDAESVRAGQLQHYTVALQEVVYGASLSFAAVQAWA